MVLRHFNLQKIYLITLNQYGRLIGFSNSNQYKGILYFFQPTFNQHFSNLKFLILSCTPPLPSEQPQFVSMDYKVLKAFHRDAGPCWVQYFPQLCHVGCMSLWWWTILDTHGKLLSMKNPAALQFLTHSNWCAWHLLSYPMHPVLTIHALKGTHTHNPCLNCLKA